MTVSAGQRFTKEHPCPVCRGHADMPVGIGERDWGFISSDGRFAHCMREEFRGRLSPRPSKDGAFVHLVQGDCLCGVRHGGGPGLPTATYRPSTSSPASTTNGNGHKDQSAEAFAGLHLQELADFKRLPVDFLRRLGCRDDTYQELPAVSFPCKDAEGNIVLTRYRRALMDQPDFKRFASQKGARLILYGLDRLASFQRPGAVLLVEGESDCWTGWFHDLPIIGVPGAKSWQSEWATHLVGLTVFVWQEPGADGRMLVEKIAADIPDLRVVVAPIGVKDISEAHVQGKDVVAVLGELSKRSRPAKEILAQTTVPKSGEKRIRCRTAADIGEATPETIPWIAEPWIALGTLTELDGAIKASGKTTFSLAMVRAIVNGELFLGQPTLRSPVVYLTEQPDTTYRESLRRAGLLECRDLHVITWIDTAGYSWEQVVDQALDLCKEVGAKLLVTDTLGQFSGVRGDSENDSGAALDAVRPLLLVAGAGIGVWIDRHDRKGGGDVGESGRGSSAYGGTVDTILRLHRMEGNTRPTMRQLDSLSRFDQTPSTLVIELTTDRGWHEYKALGSGPDVALQIEKEKIFDATPADGSPVTAAELFGKAANGTQDRALKALVEDDRLIRHGKGVRGSAYTYRRKTVEGPAIEVPTGASVEESVISDSPQTQGIHGENELAVLQASPTATVSLSESTDRCLECGQIDWIRRPDGTRLCGHCVQAAGTGRDS